MIFRNLYTSTANPKGKWPRWRWCTFGICDLRYLRSSRPFIRVDKNLERWPNTTVGGQGGSGSTIAVAGTIATGG